jgi:hypothetical protein
MPLTAAGRVYAAYGAVYVSVALVWLRVVDGVPLTLRDLVGVVVLLVGMRVLMGGGQRGGCPQWSVLERLGILKSNDAKSFPNP